MAKVEIKNRFTGAVLFECELPAEMESESAARQLGYAVKEARKRGAYLRGADLRDADLRGADLRDADLRDAYLRDADLRGAYLSGADLSDAYLSGAIGAPANSEATAETKEQRLEREAARAARFRERFPDVPVVPAIDAKILAAVGSDSNALDMSFWHSCETTHSRAGWAVHLAGEAGYALERKYDAEYAGRAIYIASAGYVPNFFDTNTGALADIKARAAEQEAA